MKLSHASSHTWVYSLTVILLVGAVVLRSLLSYTNDAQSLALSMGLLAGWLLIFLAETAITRRAGWFFAVYLVIQSIMVFVMLMLLEDADFISVLYAILGMQIMQRFEARLGILLIALFTPLIMLSAWLKYSVEDALILGFMYTAVNALLGGYALATRRAQVAQDRNQQMVLQLQETNLKLQSYAQQLERLSVARERSNLARELHDSVTQTIFSMTLTTQSAALLLERNPEKVPQQLEHLNQLAQSAQAELQELITRLNPEIPELEGLSEALRQHIQNRHFPGELTVSLEILSEGSLRPAERHGLFRIVQEALNNIVKHARASQAAVRLYLAEPQWIEIEDNGQGFTPQQTPAGGMGLAGMRERAEEIGWMLKVASTPGEGTCIRVEKDHSDKGQP